MGNGIFLRLASISVGLLVALTACGGARQERPVTPDASAADAPVIPADAGAAPDISAGMSPDAAGIQPGAAIVGGRADPNVDRDALLRQIDDLISEADSSLAAERDAAMTMGE